MPLLPQQRAKEFDRSLFFFFFTLPSSPDFPDAAPKAASGLSTNVSPQAVSTGHIGKKVFSFLKKKTATERECAESRCRLRLVKEADLLDEHSLIGQQLQLNPAPFWGTQVRKLLQHVDV